MQQTTDRVNRQRRRKLATKCRQLERLVLRQACALIDDPATMGVSAVLRLGREWAVAAVEIEEYEGLDREHAARLTESCEAAWMKLSEAIRFAVGEEVVE